MVRTVTLSGLAALLATALVAGVFIAVGGASPRANMPLPDLVEVRHAGDRALWVQRLEVTVTDWNACHDAGACTQRLRASGGRVAQDTPATTLSHPDAEQYVAWISAQTGQPFRLPSAAEWGAIAADVLRATPDPIFTDPNLRWASAYLLEEGSSRALKPRGSFSVTRDGIGDLDGSVWEWTQDCAVPALADRCPAYIAAGEHMAVVPYLERDPARGGCAVGAPPAHLGMRLVSDRAPRVAVSKKNFLSRLQPKERVKRHS